MVWLNNTSMSQWCDFRIVQCYNGVIIHFVQCHNGMITKQFSVTMVWLHISSKSQWCDYTIVQFHNGMITQ